MQSDQKFTKYLKAQDDSNQQRRALNNLIRVGLGGDYKPVAVLAEALIILNLNFVLSAQILLILIRRHRNSINSEIEEELMDVKCKLDFKTPQTAK